MNWTQTQSSFRYDGKPVTRRKAVVDTPFGIFKVYEAVGGNFFIVHPFISREPGMPGFDPDPHNEFSTPKIQVKSFEEGIRACEAKWEQVKAKVNSI